MKVYFSNTFPKRVRHKMSSLSKVDVFIFRAFPVAENLEYFQKSSGNWSGFSLQVLVRRSSSLWAFHCNP